MTLKFVSAYRVGPPHLDSFGIPEGYPRKRSAGGYAWCWH
jgi:hypothetical protein